MYKLYWRERTGAFAPAADMEELGIPYEPIKIETETRENETAEYRAINPMAQIPTLVLPDGSIMTESAAISLYLAESKPESGLAPPADDARRGAFLRWLFFAQINIYETDLRYYYPDRYTSDPAGAEGVKQAASARLPRLWDMTAEAIEGPFFFGARFTVLDIYLAMLGSWHAEPSAMFARQPKVKGLVEATVARPAIGELWRRYHMHKTLD